VSGLPLSVTSPLGIDENPLIVPEQVDEVLEAIEDELDDADWDEEQP
jgi:hypothetical protein